MGTTKAETDNSTAGKASGLARRRVIEDWMFISPQLFLFVLLTLVPFIVAFPILFTDMSGFNDPQVSGVGFDNFTAIFDNASVRADYFPALKRTLVFVGLNYLLVYVFGLSLALLMFEFGVRKALFTVIYMPLMLSGLAVGYLAVMLFSQETGNVNLLLMDLGLISKPIDLYSSGTSRFVLPLMVGWRYAGFNMSIFLVGLLAIPTDTIEASIVDGANYWQRLTRIYFPQMWPSFIIATTMALIGAFSVFDELVAMGALYVNPEAKFLSILFFTYGFQLDRLALGMTLAVVTSVPLMAVGLVLLRLQRKVQY